MADGKRAETVLSVGLAVVLIPLAAYVVVQRYRGAINGPLGMDFRLFLDAAREVRSGRDPYAIDGYVYTPLLAALLAPFAGLEDSQIWRLWSGLSVAALVATCGVCTAALRVPRRWWPAVCAAIVVTAFRWFPTTLELFLGQVDTVVVLVLALGALAAVRGWSVGVGSSIGVTALLKTWPLGLAVFLFRKAARAARQREAIALASWLVMGAVATGVGFGATGFWDMVERTLGKSSQPGLVSYSVTGLPRVLFEGVNGYGPVTSSSGLRIATAAVLIGLVLVALVVIVRAGKQAQFVRWWGIAGAIVLLLPVSHPAYRLLMLPLVWGWVAEAVRRRGWVAVTMAGVSLAWWLVAGEVRVGTEERLVGPVVVFVLSDLVLVISTAAALWLLARSPTEGAPAVAEVEQTVDVE